MADATASAQLRLCQLCAYTPPDGLLEPVPVAIGKSGSVMPRMEGGGSIIVEKTEAEGLETRLDLPEKLTAPVEAGQQIGELSILNGEEVLLTVPLTAAESVEAKGVGDLFLSFWNAVLAGGQ